MAEDVYGILFGNVRPVTGDTYHGSQTAPDEETFLRTVITPIYQVLHKVIIVLLYCTYCLFQHLQLSIWKLIIFVGKRKPRETRGAGQAILGGETMMI